MINKISFLAAKTQLYKLPKVTQGYPRLQKVNQDYMQFHEITGISMSLHAVPRAGMQFNDLAPCISKVT